VVRTHRRIPLTIISIACSGLSPLAIDGPASDVPVVTLRMLGIAGVWQVVIVAFCGREAMLCGELGVVPLIRGSTKSR